MAGKQVEFQENHTHKKNYEYGMLILSLVCIVFVIIAVNVVGGGGYCVEPEGANWAIC